MTKRICWAFSLLAAAFFLTGCKQVVEEPKVDLRKMGTVALLEFDNLTSDFGIAVEATSLLADELSKLQGLELLIPNFGDPEFSSRTAQEGDAGKVAARLGADTLLMGAVTYYFEDVYLEPPRRVLLDKEKDLYRWELRQETNVEVVLSMQLISKDRKVLFSRQATGSSSRLKTNRLSWPGESEYLPPFSALSGTDRRQLPTVRREALRDAIRKLASSYLPQYSLTW
jgi:hypothetical protein